MIAFEKIRNTFAKVDCKKRMIFNIQHSSFLLVRNSVVANIWSFDASSFQLAKPERSKLQFRAFAKRVDVPFAGNLLISLK